MSTEQTESTQQPAGQQQPPTAEWGAQPPPAAPRSKWTVKRTVIAVVVAVGIAGAGGAAIYAASGSVDNSQGGGPGGMRGGPGGGQMVVGGPMGSLDHGEFQTGEVTAISADSITVKSEDDYEQTYVIDDETQVASGIEKGDEVTVIATTEDDKTTAETVMEFGAMPGQGNRRDGNGTPPSDGNGTPPNDGN
jgi:hypothetical protein